MPKYTFKCSTCSNETQRSVPSSVISLSCPTCSSDMKRLLPRLNGSSRVNETVDNYLGVVRQVDQDEQIQLRKAEYYWTVEVPRFVASGIYSVETMLENSWIYIDEKGEVKVNDKPPHRR